MKQGVDLLDAVFSKQAHQIDHLARHLIVMP